jgi:hypothetical protein
VYLIALVGVTGSAIYGSAEATLCIRPLVCYVSAGTSGPRTSINIEGNIVAIVDYIILDRGRTSTKPYPAISLDYRVAVEVRRTGRAIKAVACSHIGTVKTKAVPYF